MVALAFSRASIVAQTILVFTLRKLADAVDSSAAPNVTQLGHTVNWYTYFNQHFKKVKGISSYHHFIFSTDYPGTVQVNEFADGPQDAIEILKAGAAPQLSAAHLPDLLPGGGLTREGERSTCSGKSESSSPPRFRMSCALNQVMTRTIKQSGSVCARVFFSFTLQTFLFLNFENGTLNTHSMLFLMDISWHRL